jgi:predicted membrane metal-binding protein
MLLVYSNSFGLPCGALAGLVSWSRTLRDLSLRLTRSGVRHTVHAPESFGAMSVCGVSALRADAYDGLRLLRVH